MKELTEKQMHTRLNNYYKVHYGENDTDEFYVNPSPNKWKFIRDGRIIILTCNVYSGKVTEE